jgi:hypothetical protein
MSRRSGTNFLYDLICLHPDCARVEAIWEDFALARADRLQDYASAVAAAWHGDWDPDGEHRRALLRRLGEGVVRFLADRVAAARECGVPFLLVRYEDLLADLEGELRRIFDHLDLDPQRVDFAAAARLPVRGSSSFGVGGGGVHWSPVAKTADFQPVNRWAGWTRRRRQRFLWLAGDRMRELGYSDLEPPRHPLAWQLANRLCDGALALRSRVSQQVKRAARRSRA